MALCPSTPQGGTRWTGTIFFVKNQQGTYGIKVLKVNGRCFFYTLWLFWLCMVVYGWRQPMAGVWNKTRNPKPGGRDVPSLVSLWYAQVHMRISAPFGWVQTFGLCQTYTVICHAWHWVIITFCHLWLVCTEQREHNVQVPYCVLVIEKSCLKSLGQEFGEG